MDQETKDELAKVREELKSLREEFEKLAKIVNEHEEFIKGLKKEAKIHKRPNIFS
jgi:hypothetical protein